MPVDTDKAARQCIGAVVLICCVVTIAIAISNISPWWIAGVWIGAVPAMLILSLFVGMILNALGARIPADKHKLWLDEDDYEYSPNVLGTFGEKDIHEWVIISHPEDPTQKITLEWNSTIDLENIEFIPPTDKWFLLVPPGIVYHEKDPVAA